MYCGIYRIHNKINDKNYIGQSVNITDRWRKHRSTVFATQNPGYNYPIYRAIRKYGLENFELLIEEECKPEELNEKEIYYINKYQSYCWQNGYNIAFGGSNGGHYVVLNESSFWDIHDLLKETNLSEQHIANMFSVSLDAICKINVGSRLYHTEVSYPIRQTRNNKFCKICGKKLTSDNSTGYCKECMYFVPKDKDTFLKECFLYSFSKVASINNTTKKQIQGWLKRNNYPYNVKEYKNWYKEEHNIKTTKIERTIIQIDPVTNKELNSFRSYGEAARYIGFGLSNRGSHIREAAIGLLKQAYGYKWRIEEKIVDEQ